MAPRTFNEVYNLLTSRVYEDDYNSQAYYLSVVESQRNIPVNYLMERGCLFIPNNDYIHHYIGSDANQFGLEFYNGDRCLWALYVLLPVTDLVGDVVGLVGWDALHKFQESEGETGLSMYKVSSKNVFRRERFFLSDATLLKSTFDTRTVFITDGVFDSVALNYRGIPALALLGSTFSPEILYFLRWYKRIYVCADNDSAGMKLYKMLNKSLPGVCRVYQSEAKDIEEALRGDGKDGPLTQQFFKVMQGEVTGDLYLSNRRVFRRD